ncbi:MAG: ATP-binding protein, partial [Terriglobia bacterium]
SSLPRKTLRNDLKVFDGSTVSILRNDREAFFGPMPWLTTRHSVTLWYRIQIDFPGILDEAFGVATNKQGVRLKGYVEDAIKDAIGEEITTINDEIKRFQAQQASTRQPAKPSASETRASEADPFQQNALAGNSPEEEAQLEENLRGLALTLKRDNETDEQALERIKNSKYVIDFKHDEYWPFYDVKHRFGRIILTINTAHPFFGELYDPVRKMGLQPGTDGEEMAISSTDTKPGPILALDLLLLSLARTQSRLSANDDDVRKMLDVLRREWSETYRVQLNS